MSDIGRQSFTDKVGAAVKPDSQKTTTEHLGDKFHGKPQGEKSFGQKVGDTFTGGSSTGANNNASVMDKAKSAMGMGDKH
ncbi:hypothetical protein AURDEDRAFT_75451 [Auricularia subglabra TFB-10046 SS5]|uniref:Chaperone/heat shock protein Hsp12 n=1 Tax=Auricularia subglabra (strain TFB-10046 / SS5) TaxID=717982 RepID=J0LEL9_AURST|nr:hypothetical protein AURDEDRAFT_75451 [Auricularia subglabra TFB-10046 SS5]